VPNRWRWPLFVWIVADLWTDLPFAWRKSIEVSALVFAIWMWLTETLLPIVVARVSALLAVLFIVGLFAYWRMRGVSPTALVTIALILVLFSAVRRLQLNNAAPRTVMAS
jgi:hypothetical protein